MNVAAMIPILTENSPWVSKAELRARKRAVIALKDLGKYGSFSIPLTEDQLRQIDEARARGDKITVSINFS